MKPEHGVKIKFLPLCLTFLNMHGKDVLKTKLVLTLVDLLLDLPQLRVVWQHVGLSPSCGGWGFTLQAYNSFSIAPYGVAVITLLEQLQTGFLVFPSCVFFTNARVCADLSHSTTSSDSPGSGWSSACECAAIGLHPKRWCSQSLA